MNDILNNLRRLAKAVNQIDGICYLLAKRSGLNQSTLAFLYALADGEPHTQKEICDKYLIPRTTINTVAKELLDKQYIVFLPDRISKEKILQLTELGMAYALENLEEFYYVNITALENTITQYSAEFIAALEAFSDDMQQTLNSLAHE